MPTSELLAIALLLAPAQAPAPEVEAALHSAIRVWLCPLHPETHRDGAATCDVCRRPFEERSVTRQWSCPMHAQFVSTEEGICPVCAMPRVVTSVEVVWRCPVEPEDVQTAPGMCRGGSDPLVPELRALAHGDHNPRHGGQFFMASDRFHHVEATLSDGRFRLYLYDNYTEPLPATAAAGRLGEIPFTESLDGRALEAPFEAPLPVELVVRVDFGAGEQRFDFVFTDESRPPALPELVIPESAEALLVEIEVRDARLQELMRLGAWTELYLPALQAKELALALVAREPSKDGVAVNRLVRGAWLLDMYGDVADREQVDRAYALFREGWQALQSAP